MAKDEEVGRTFTFSNGKVSSIAGLHGEPDIKLAFKNAKIAARLLRPPINWLDQINAQKDFNISVEGPEDLTNWFAQTIMMTQSIRWKWGKEMPDGVTRTVNMTNGGPVFVDVKDDKIIRMTPIDFDETDPQPWTIKARAWSSHPPRRTTLAPHGQNAKSIVYSPDRLLYPMKRVDFDPNGERNTQNRGISGYERISWDEALDIVASEIKRARVSTARGLWWSATARTIHGAILATTRRRFTGSARGRPARLRITTRTAGKAGTGARYITGATRCASASRKPTARLRTACRTAT